ncbi:MAG: acetate/propionate family kinase [Pseudomonadota bacterium]
MSSMQPAVLAVNAGSSSLKFALYPLAGDTVAPSHLSGMVEGLEPGGTPCLRLHEEQDDSVHALDGGADGFACALEAIDAVLRYHAGDYQVCAVAHRIVHGGERYRQSIVLDDEALGYLGKLVPLAPMHLPHNLACVEVFRRTYPLLPQMACFDTAFHATLSEVETMFALPATLRSAGIRRYGFHGLSYRYVVQRLAADRARPGARMLVAHLGSGASACAIVDGRSVATTMGFSALDGLMMGTRCGALDPGVLVHLVRQGWTLPDLEHMLYHEAGLLGVSGISADMRTLRASAEPAAAQAIDLFTHRFVREVGGLVACMGGLDLLAFSGGIGEHDAELRQQSCAALAHLGVQLDPEANAAARGDAVLPLHAAASAVEVWVVPTDEAFVAASDAARLFAH